MSRVVKIVHVVYRFDTGGLENGMVNLINRLDENAYQHTIVTMNGHSPEFAKRIKTNNVSFADLNKKDGNDPGVFIRLNSLLKDIKPDVLHTRNMATLEMQLVGWWRRIPLRIHGEHGWDVNDMHGQNRTYQKLRRIMRLFTHQYIALSKEANDYLLDIIHVNPKRVNHICNGVDDSKFSPQSTENDIFTFGCVGRLAAVKNHVLLAHAFVKTWKTCQQQDIPVRLNLIGEGDCRKEVETIFNQAGCMDSVWMPGNRGDVAELMQDFDAFILPSLAEGISNTILEAMASGLPVIATSVGGNCELVDDTVSGYLVPADSADTMADKMIGLVTNKTLVEQMGNKGRERVEQKYSMHSMTKAYDALYQRAKHSH